MIPTPKNLRAVAAAGLRTMAATCKNSCRGPARIVDVDHGLFDFSFTTFVTARVLRVLYGLYIAMLGLMLFGGLVTGGMAVLHNSVLSGLFMMAITPILTLMGVVSGRIVFECIAVFFRIAEHLGEINRKMKEP